MDGPVHLYLGHDRVDVFVATHLLRTSQTNHQILTNSRNVRRMRGH